MKRTEIEFPPKHAALRDDVHMLGSLVGEVLREQGGIELFELVERDRTLAIARRNGDVAAASELDSRVTDRAPALARDLERAFSSWFQSVNLAEQVHRIRRRRAYFQDDAERPQPGGIGDAIAKLKDRGLSREHVIELLEGMQIQPIFMSHPTESTRRTILRKQQRLATLLYDRLNPTLAPNEQRASLGRIRTEITTAWQTEDHPRQRLTVADEREHVLFFLAEILYRVVPGFYEEIAEALTSNLQAKGARFEWIAARQPWRQLEPGGVEAWLTVLEGLISPEGQWRLLFSTPRIGPATGLLAALKAQPIPRPGANTSFQADLVDLLRELAEQETAGLEAGDANQRIARSWLASHGWTVTSELWDESLELEISPARIARWLADGSSYRTHLEALGNQPLTAIQIELLHRGFGQRLNQTIPQQLTHHLVMARA